jgi:hypothetical protein
MNLECLQQARKLIGSIPILPTMDTLRQLVVSNDTADHTLKDELSVSLMGSMARCQQTHNLLFPKHSV